MWMAASDAMCLSRPPRILSSGVPLDAGTPLRGERGLHCTETVPEPVGADGGDIGAGQQHVTPPDHEQHPKETNVF